ncbi:MAG: ABC transporter ATP-binding protein [Nakamurella sp.]
MAIVIDTAGIATGTVEPATAPVGQEYSVVVDGVSKIYRTGAKPVQALDNVTLKVKPGEFVSLVGASGCGKSTLLNLIAGLDQPTAGTITSASRPALMFQEPALLPWLSAGKNVELALKYAGVPRGELAGRADELLATVRLAGTARRRVHELSGGQRQRVAMARALAQNSPVLLMDEPFAALDAITRDVLHDELTRIWTATGLSVVFVTHNVREAVRLGQRVVLLSSHPGRVVREWAVDIQGHRTIEHPLVGDLASDITVSLREEIARHAGDKNA